MLLAGSKLAKSVAVMLEVESKTDLAAPKKQRTTGVPTPAATPMPTPLPTAHGGKAWRWMPAAVPHNPLVLLSTSGHVSQTLVSH